MQTMWLVVATGQQSCRLSTAVQGGSDGGYIGIYTPKISLPYKFLRGYWLLFFSLTQEYKLLLILKLEWLVKIYTPNEIPGYAPAAVWRVTIRNTYACPSCENMTSHTKPEVYITYCVVVERGSSYNADNVYGKCRWSLDMCLSRYALRQTDIQANCSTLHPYRERSVTCGWQFCLKAGAVGLILST